MDPIVIAVGGIGARGLLFHISYVAKALARIWKGGNTETITRIHNFYDVHAQSEGPGEAFQLRCKAALNTNLPGPITMDMDGLSLEQRKTLSRLTDVAGRYAELMMQDPKEHIEMLKSESIFSALLLSNAMRSGNLDTSTACGPRYVVGQALLLMCEDATRLAAQYLPWLVVNFKFGVEIVDIDVKNRKLPVLTVRNKASGQEAVLPPCDLFIKATGTTWKIPVTGDLGKRAFTGIPDPSALYHHLSSNLQIDDNGLIKPGSRILIGGASLSALDHIGLILAKTRIIRLDPSTREGFTIDAAEANKYQCLITLFSRTQGDLAPARHADNRDIGNGGELVTPEMILALRLQRDEDHFRTYSSLARVVTAIRFNKLPEEIDRGSSTAEKIRLMATENELRIKEPQRMTETSFFQASLKSLFFAHALDSANTEKAINLRKSYPLLVRQTWDDFRSMSFNATHTTDGTADYLAAFRNVMKHTSAVPFAVHLLLTRLFILGVVRWKQGDYEDVRWWSESRAFFLNDEHFDILIASRVLTSESDLLWFKLSRQLMQSSPDTTTFMKGRFLSSPEGQICHVVELGLIGHGRLRKGRHSNTQWNDTNSYAGAHQLMPSLAALVTLFETSLAQRNRFPVDEIMRIYRSLLPAPSEFDYQASGLSRPYRQVMLLLLGADLVATAYPEGRTFSVKLRQLVTHGGSEIISEIGQISDKAVQRALQSFQEAFRRVVYQPVSLDRFEIMTPDFSTSQLGRMENL